MSNTEKIWIIAGIASFAGTMGLLVGLREIVHRVNSIPVHNRLTRSHGDIELGNYIEPVQPAHSYQPIDLVNLNYEPYNWADRVPSYYTGQPAPSYYSGGNPPSFNTVDRIYINCSLEDNINLDYILWLILFCVSLLMLRKLIISLIFNNSLYSISILIPFSSFEIDFRDSFEWKFNSYKVKPVISFIKLQDLTKDINLLLLSLLDDVDYSMTLSFISSYTEWEKDKGNNTPLLIEDAIIINKESDSLLITQFIMENLDKKGYFLSNWLFKDQSLNSMDPVILAVTVGIKVEI